MQEIWKDIPSFEGKYQVSNFGNVRSLNFHGENRISTLSQRNRNAYNSVTLWNGKNQKTYLVHRLVLCAFFNVPLNYSLQVNHIDGNKKNNIIENLEFVTPKENTLHAFKTGLRSPKRGSQVKTSKLNEEQVREIKKLLLEGKIMQKDIAIMFNVHKGTISDINKGKNWKHIAP